MTKLPQNTQESKFEVRDLRNGDWYWANKAVLEHPEMTGSDQSVYHALAYFANSSTQKCFPSIPRISQLTHLHSDTVIKATKHLEELGFIKVKRRSGEVNRYELLKLTEGRWSDNITPRKKHTTPKGRYGLPRTEGMDYPEQKVCNNNNNNNNLTITNSVPKGVEQIGDTMERKFHLERKKNVSKEYQSYGCRLAGLLGAKNPSQLIKVAKEVDRGLIERAFTFTSDYPEARDKTKIFFWKLNQLKNEI